MVNAWRAARGKEALAGSPGVRFLDYGKGRDGYWTHELFCEQARAHPCPDSPLPDSPLLIAACLRGSLSADLAVARLRR